MDNDFINSATRLLVRDFDNLIRSRQDFFESRVVVDSFAAFRRTCATMPSIVGYVDGRIKNAPADRIAFSPEQLELMMLGMIARSSSTYGTIPGVVAHLALVGEHADAAILNENAKNETGDRIHTPHSTLLYDCFAVIGEALHIPVLTPARYHIMRLILLGRRRTATNLTGVDAIQIYLDNADLHAPNYDRNDIHIALHYANKYGPELIKLHSVVIKAETRLDERGDTVAERNPYDRGWLAIRCLELAMREASSVDEHETNRLSFIGAWGQVVEHLAPKLSSCQLERARAWTEAHNDEEAGQAVGWEGAAEEGHAEDARDQALKVMTKLLPETFGAALDEVTKLNELRLGFWDDMVMRLEAMESS
ncbi:MAG: hypothetical protein V6Z86_01995 [Hyphomicrobiales bacterium]